MLAARAIARRVARLCRAYATIVDSEGIKVAAADHGQATSSVTFLVRAGSRYENKPGVANVLKNFAFKGTSSRSALGTVREAELYGGVLSSALTREYLALTADFLRGDEAYFVDVLSSLVTSSNFARWELDEYVRPAVEEETRVSTSNATTIALENAHAIAFRKGLGASVYAPPHVPLDIEDVKAFAAQVYAKGNIAVLGTGISQDALTRLVEKHVGSSLKASGSTSPASQYFGGEYRHALRNGGPETVFIGFGATGAPSAELAVLSAHLSSTPSIKWSKSLSPLAAAILQGTNVQPVYFPYSDAALFGLLVQGSTGDAVKDAAIASLKVLRDTASGSSIAPEELKKAVAKAKFAAASFVEDREGFVFNIGPRVLQGAEVPIKDTHAALDGVSAQNVLKAASSLLKANPTFIAVGNIMALPHKDEVGL